MKHAILLAVIPTGAFFAANSDLRPIEATKKADVQTVGSLLQQESSVYAVEANGATPLHWAAQQDNAGGLPVKPPRPDPGALSSAL